MDAHCVVDHFGVAGVMLSGLSHGAAIVGAWGKPGAVEVRQLDPSRQQLRIAGMVLECFKNHLRITLDQQVLIGVEPDEVDDA
jgi:hypothetical protein